MNLGLLLILGMLWGSSYLFIKVAVMEVPALTLVAGRLVLSALILWALLRARGRAMPRSLDLWRHYAVMGFLNGALPYSLISWGEQTIPSGLAALLQATMPLFTVLLAHVLSDDERLTWARASGVVVGFVGVGILMLPDLRQGLHASLLAQLAVVGSSVSYAGATIYARRWLRGQAPMLSTAGQVTAGAIWMLPLSLLVDRPFDLAPSLPALGSWAALVVLGTVVAYVIYYALLENASATFVSLVTYIIPIHGLLLGALVLREPVDLTVIASLALILLGVLVVRT
jgi:drug/metabolite transporter (DMT)-like permease